MNAKRLVDLVIAIPGVIALGPVFAIAAAAVKLESHGPVLFRQERIGKDGHPFRILKFRSMVVDAEQRGPPLTSGGDPRITRVGRWLRATKVDELPQLLNVIAGEMSLVGPRPEVSKYVELYSESQRRVLVLVPGITDPASIRFSDESSLLASFADPERAYVEQIMPEKIRLNLEYAANATWRSDLQVILATVLKIVRRK